jgi:hypothetical protein
VRGLRAAVKRPSLTADSSGVETAAPAPLPRRISGALAWPRLGVGLTLTLLVSVSTVVRSLASWSKATPSYFPDEYLYAELARSLADTGRPLVRGAEASFPALLQPALTWPLWLVEDVALSYHAVQALGALAMSLAAVPTYVLARRLALGTMVSLGCAAFTLAIPDFLYASRVLAEPFAYPLLLAAVAAGTLALARGGFQRQLVFLVLVALVVLARVQFFVLPLAYVVAVGVVGVRERALLQVARRQVVPLVSFGIGLAVSLIHPGLVGQYGAFLDVEFEPGLAGRLATNAFGLSYTGGWLLMPGALLGLVLAVRRPRSREELAFAALAAPLTLGLLLEASVYGDLGRIQERYFFYALPLVALLFVLYAARGWPHRRIHALLAGGALALVATTPITFATTALDKTQSPFLFAAYRLEVALGESSTGALVLAVAVSLLLACAVAGSFQPRAGTAMALALATAFCALGSLAAVVLDLENTSRLRERYLPDERSWIDRAGLEDVALLRTSEPTADTHLQLFWNRSVTSLLTLQGIAAPDAYRLERVSVARDGALLSDGRPVVRPLVIDEILGPVELTGAVPVAEAPTRRLWRPNGVPRLSFLAEGYFDSGWLGRAGRFRVWPSTGSDRLDGRIGFRASPEFSTELVVRGAFGRRVFRLVAGTPTTVTIPVCGRDSWAATFESSESRWDGGRFVSTPATRPTWEPDPAACR